MSGGNPAIKEDTFKTRNTGEYSKAEKAAEKYFGSFNELLYLRYGFDQIKSRIPVNQWIKIPQFVRCSPDYATVYNGEFNFIEVKGCLDTVKIKLTDFVEYGKWSQIAELKIFIHSSSTNHIYVLKYDELLNYISTEGNKFGRYNDNSKLYFEIPLEKIEKFKRC